MDTIQWRERAINMDTMSVEGEGNQHGQHVVIMFVLGYNEVARVVWFLRIILV